ncbi:unnamed protein product [Cochlearia groenlandica]
MERAAIFPSLNQNYLLLPSRAFTTRLHTFSSTRNLSPSSSSIKVEERNVTVDELLEADEVFSTGTAVVVSPVGSITYKGKKCLMEKVALDLSRKRLYTVLTSLQMGLSEDNMNWTVNLS